MRKIAHLITGLNVGGAEQMLLEILPRLENSELKNTVYCLMGRGLIGDELQKRNIPVIYLNYRHFWNLPRTIIRFLKIMKQNKPDSVVTYLIHADLFGRILAPWAGINSVISFKRGALLQWEFLKYFDHLTSQLVTRYLTVSNTLRAKLINELKISPSKIQVVYNGVDLKYFQNQNHKIDRSEFGLSNNMIVLSIIASLRRGKGHRELLWALSSILRNEEYRGKIKLLIVGNGEKRESLHGLSAKLKLTNDVIFTGTRQDIPAILNIIDIFVLPTYFEGMSVALLEAMAAKKPIVTTDIPENREILKSYYSALLVPPRNVDLLAQAIISLIENQSLKNHLAQNAYQECLHKYTIETTVSELKNIFLTV